MDLICLWVGRVVIVSFGVAGAVWLVSLPLEFAWKSMRANAAFVSAFYSHARKSQGKSQDDSW